MTRRIGIYAGSFDPIHNGHIEVARGAVNYLELEQLYFMVENSPWGDKKPASSKHRIEMVQRSIGNDPRMKVLACRDERFTIEQTLPKIELEFSDAELFFIFGADVFLKMDSDQWPGLSELLRHYLVIFERGEASEKEIEKHAVKIGATIAILPSAHPQHRSSDVRARVHDKQLWVSSEVAQYIDQHNMYYKKY